MNAINVYLWTATTIWLLMCNVYSGIWKFNKINI